MKRIEKIYRDKPSAEELAWVISEEPCYSIGENCTEHKNCIDCVRSWLEEEVPEYDADFVEKLKAVKLLFPWSQYLVMNRSGCAFIFDDLPVKNDYGWICREEAYRSMFIYILNKYSNDWENSLIDIDKVLEEAKHGTVR